MKSQSIRINATGRVQSPGRSSCAAAILSLAALALGGCQSFVADATAALGGRPPIHLSLADTTLADSTVQQALETQSSGAALSWRNADTGASGSVTPVRTFRAAGDYFCRDYVEILVVDRQTAQSDATACRDSDGMWKSVP